MAKSSPKLTEAIVASWLRRIDEIHRDLSGLVHSAWLYREVRRIVEANAAVNKPSPFHQWCATNYGNYACAAVRRMVDRTRKTASLRLLLDEIECHHRSITRAWHKQIYPSDGRAQEIAERTFANLTGSRDATFFPVSIVREDLVALDRACAPVAKFATKRIAHLALHEEGIVPPRFEEIDVAIATLQRVFIRYLGLLTGSSPPSLLPIYMYDWKAVLRVPWIDPAEEPDG